eukprot:757124-Hanusia_phi.AAC.1
MFHISIALTPRTEIYISTTRPASRGNKRFTITTSCETLVVMWVVPYSCLGTKTQPSPISSSPSLFSFSLSPSPSPSPSPPEAPAASPVVAVRSITLIPTQARPGGSEGEPGP